MTSVRDSALNQTFRVSPPTPTDVSEGRLRRDRAAVLSAAGCGGASAARGDGDAGGRGASGSPPGGGDPRAPGAALHRAQAPPDAGGEALTQPERRGLSTGKA